MTRKAAFITGGASGMGLAVAEALSARDEWDLHIVDLNASAGLKAVSTLKNAHFHQTDVTSYESLTAAFEAAFKASGRLDFVYANAGIVERDNFYEKHDLSKPPPEPNQLSVDINYKSVVNTTWLALHYFRKSEKTDYKPLLIMTASCGGLYPSEFCPMYSGSKAAVIHFNRAISFAFRQEGIRTYATAPGTIRTNLMNSDEWKSFPEQFFTPMKTLVRGVLLLVDGGDLEDSNGRKVAEEDAYGLTVEVNGDNIYFRDQAAFSDKNMEDMMKFTSMKNQLARIEKTKSEQNEVNGA
ncbi:NAD(P)-binding protein [Aaosphaeria arxii CBS 175.79]|uniref:NAD(P)-binding protein n=1 Tax=Aaosphaeria arxii CBS 175.79 TaxID=1450172 RepID=A0A6A5XLV6_9PLEO|nr:NAD(P)-binding protein [Aaosphaeria arxii CBS 175.79]KAF2013896.1 NAD(P)-binding protein [Aaosphaeria arxii CBS 175.79]